MLGIAPARTLARHLMIVVVALAVVAPTLVPAPEAAAQSGNLVPNPGYETASWGLVADAEYPGTSSWRANWGSSTPRSGAYGMSLSNLSYASIYSELVPVTSGASYDFHAWVRGQLDPASASNWQLQVVWYDGTGSQLSWSNAAAGGHTTVDTLWAREGGTITAPAGAVDAVLNLQLFLGSGWVAYDDVTFVEVGGGGTNLAPSPGFEDAAGWTEWAAPEFPAGATFRGGWGIAAPRTGSFAWSLSNHGYGTLESSFFPVSGGEGYDVRAKVRGELEPGTHGFWIVRAYWYDAAGGIVGQDDAAIGGYGSISTQTWNDEGSTLTAPATATEARVFLIAYMISGWVVFDDVRFSSAADPQTNLVPNPSFESGETGWTEVVDPDFTGTSIRHGSTGISEPVDGTSAWAVSNLATGYLESDPFPVDAGAQYQAEAWLRGEIDPATHGDWAVRVAWYDSAGNPVDTDPTEAATGGEGSLTTTYALQGGAVTAPPDAADARFEVYVHNLSGWVGVDDASVVETAPPPPPPPPPELVVTPSPLDATIVEGSIVIGTIELTSTGDPLPFSLFDDSDIIAGYYPSSGTTPETVTVYTHSYLERGFHTGYITGSINVDVNLTITGPIPDLAASPSPVGFPTTAVGLTNDETVTLSSLGSGDDGHIVVDSIAVTGADAAEFSTDFTDPVTLVPAATTDVTVTFAPQSAGAKAAQLEVHHNGPNSPVVVPLDAPQPAGLADATVLLDPAAVTTAAGNGTAASVDGIGENASFGSMVDATFSDGVLFVAENSVIRTFDPGTGVVATLTGDAGDSQCVESSDPTLARFKQIKALAADDTHLWVLDDCPQYQARIWRVDRATGGTEIIEDLPSNARDITVAPDGDVYVIVGDTIREVLGPDNVVTRYDYPGNDPELGFTGDVYSVAADSTHVWLIASAGRRLDKVDRATWTPTIVVADTRSSYDALESAGDYVYLPAHDVGLGASWQAVDRGLRRYSKIDGSGTLVAGSGSEAHADGVEVDAWFSAIEGVASDGEGLWIADGGSNLRIRRAVDGPPIPRAQSPHHSETLSIDVPLVVTAAGSGVSEHVDGFGTEAGFVNPRAVVVAQGAAWIADDTTIRRLDLATGEVTTFAGQPGVSGCNDSPDPAQATFKSTLDMTTDGSFLYLYQKCNSSVTYVRRVSLATGAVSTGADLQATPDGIAFGADGYLYSAWIDRINQVDVLTHDNTEHVVLDDGHFRSLTADDAQLYGETHEHLQFTRVESVSLPPTMNNVVVADGEAPRIESAGDYLYAEHGDTAVRRLHKATGVWEDVAGDPSASGYQDGFGPAARFGRVEGLATDGQKLVVTDRTNYRVRFVVEASDFFAGAGSLGYDADGAWRAGVNGILGNFVTSSTDVEVATAGPALAISRTYNSRDPRPGMFGRGWSSSYEMRWSQNAAGDIAVQFPDGRREIHTDNGDGTYSPPSGYHSTLAGSPAAGFTLETKDGTTYALDAGGKLTSITDSNGLALTLTYDAQDQLDLVTDDSGRFLDFTWADGHVTAVATDSVAQHGGPLVWKYYYAGDELTEACDPRDNAPTGSCTRYEYALGRLVEVRRPMGNVEAKLGYNPDGSVQWRQDGLGNATTFAYPEPGRVEITDPRGHTTIQEYDVDELRLTRETDPAGGVTVHAYDADGNRDSITDANGHVVAMDYDARGNLISTTNPELQTTHFAYDAEDNLTDVRDPRSGSPGSSNWDAFKTTYTYDAAGNRLSERNAVGDTTNWTYTDGTEPAIDGGTMPPGLVETMLNPKGGQTTYEYDRYGDLRRMTGPTGLVTDYTYDEIGRMLSDVATDAVAGATTGVWHGYDQVSNPVVTTESAVVNVVTGETHQLQVTRVFDGNGNVTSVIETDIAGSDPTRTTVLEYDANDREFRVTDPEGGVMARGFDAAGNVTSVTDQEGRVVETTYNSRNLPETVVAKDFVDDPVAGTTPRDIVMSVITYDAAGRKLTETDAEGRVTEWSYDKADRVEKVTLLGFDGAEGPRDIVLEEYAYDPAGNPFSEKYGTGKRVVSNSFDPVGRLETTTLDPGGLARVTTLAYDANGNVESVTLADAQRTEVTTHVFDAADRLERTIVENGAVDLETNYGYDQRGNVVSVTDPRGAITDFDNDLLGRRVRATAPAVTVVEHGTADVSLRPETATGYDAWGNPTHARDARGFVTETRYDGLDRRIEIRHPAYTGHDSVELLPVELFGYDKVGNLESRTSRRGEVTDYVYDAFNRLVQQTDPLVTGELARGVVRHTYDDVGNRESTVDQRGARTEWEYDDLNRVRLVREIVRQPSGPDDVYETTYLYDDLGNVNHTTYPDQSTTSALHNAASELETTTDQLGQVTSYEHDVAGRRTRVEDPSGRATEWVYDQAGRLEREQRWIGQTQLAEIVYGTDPNGNVDSVTTALGYETVFGFDALNRLTSVTVPVGPAEEIATSYGYDASGNRTEVVDGRGNVWSTTYQSWNLAADYHEPDVSPAQGGTFTTWYDAGGLPVREDQPGGVTITRTFDELGRLTDESGTGGVAASRAFGYDLAGLRTEVSHPDGDLVFTYDDRGLMTEVVAPAGAPEYGATFVYDELGRLEQRADAAGTTSFAWTARGELDTATDPLTGTVVDYDWDTSGRLQTVDYGSAVRTVVFDDHGRLDTDTLRDAASAVVAAFDYGYDDDDNLRTVDVTLPGNPQAGMHSYDYDQAGRLEQWTSPATGAVSYDWDASGNRRQAGADVYAYDARNRLTSGPQGTYTYSARGTLASITDGPDTTTFGYDALGRLVDYDGQVAYVYDGLDRVARRDGVKFGYTGFGLDPTDDGQFTYSRTPAGRVLAQSDGATAALTGLNRHGDLSYLFAPSGAVSDTYVYDPFGGVAGATGSTNPTIGYQGDYTDPTSGDVWMGARWYSPSDAAFRSRDTVFGELMTPVTLNRYTYARGNPLSYWDPDGRRGCPVALEIGCSTPGQTASRVARADEHRRLTTTGESPEAGRALRNKRDGWNPVPQTATGAADEFLAMWAVDRAGPSDCSTPPTSYDRGGNAPHGPPSSNPCSTPRASQPAQPERCLTTVSSYTIADPNYRGAPEAQACGPDGGDLMLAALPWVIAAAPGGGVAALGVRILGRALLARILTGAAAGVAADQTYLATENLVQGDPVAEGLANPRDLALSAAVGGALNGAFGARPRPQTPAPAVVTIETPYQVRLDPATRRGPWGLDTTGYSGPKTSAGGVRNSRAFWQDWSDAYGHTLSDHNRVRIEQRLSPVVDDVWVQSFPEHGGFIDEKLVHHHLDGGPIAIPLPEPVHRNVPGFGIWHGN